jgi:hypothetical protein
MAFLIILSSWPLFAGSSRLSAARTSVEVNQVEMAPATKGAATKAISIKAYNFLYCLHHLPKDVPCFLGLVDVVVVNVGETQGAQPASTST